MPPSPANSREAPGGTSAVSTPSYPEDISGTRVSTPPCDHEAEALPDNSVGQTTAWQKIKDLYWGNIGLFFVFLAQMFGSLVRISRRIELCWAGFADQDEMSTATRLLETGFETKFHALQIIFVRMLSTAVLGSLYMWYTKVPDFPFGNRGVRGLLVLRGTAGFLGLFGAYCKPPPF
jgi:hypothetical protein